MSATPSPEAKEITHLLEERDYDRLAPLVQKELERIARQRLRALRPGATLDTCALIGELYDKLLRGKIDVEFKDRGHFYAVAADAMKNILINHARARYAQKRGGGVPKVRLGLVGPVPAEERAVRLLAVEDALERLAKENERAARVMKLRYFGSLTVKETAEVLGVSERTVSRDHHHARLWLARAMTPDPPA